MKLSQWIVAGLMAGLSNSYAALAEDEGSFTFHLPLVNYSNSSAKAKSEGVTSTVKTTQTKTADLDGSYLEASWGKANLYLYPFADSKKISPSYLVTDAIEVGLDLGINASTIDMPKNSDSSSLFGVFGIYYANLTKTIVLENSLNIGMKTNSGTVTETVAGVATETKSKNSDLTIAVSVNAVVPLAKNVQYVGGLSYTMDNNDDKQNKVKTSTGTLGVNLATVRLILK